MSHNRLHVLALRVLVCLAVSLGLAARPALAKKKPKISRTVTGVVLDASNQGIGGASVQLKDLKTGETQAMYTDRSGNYSFTDLKQSDDYQVQANYRGESSETRTASTFDNRDIITLNLHIPPPKDQ